MGSSIFTLLAGTLAERPTQAEEGRCYFAFDTRVISRYLGGQWVDQDPPMDPPPHYTKAQIDAYIDGITSLAELRSFLKRLVKYLVVKI